MLETLYNGIPQSSAIRSIIDEHLHRSKPNPPKVDMEVIGCVVEDLMGHNFRSRYRYKNFFPKMMYSKITWKTSWVLRSVPPYRKITPNTKQDNFLLPSAFDFLIHCYLN